MSENPPEIHAIKKDLEKLEREMKVVLSHTRSLWGSSDDLENSHFPYTLYGFVMVAMAKIDYFSRHWVQGEQNQTKRMVDFMRHFLGYAVKASEIAVQFFRHNLMHTSTLATISDKSGNTYQWLLHYGDGKDLPKTQHMILQNNKLDAGATYLLEDLISAIPKLQRAIEQRPDIRNKWEAVERNMRSFPKLYEDDRSGVPASQESNK